METVQPRIFSVAELNNYLREYLAEDDFLRELAVRGEIAGFKAHSSGHIYFNLREQGVSIKTVMFRSYAAHLDFLPEDGMEVVVIGGVALFERDGVCQLYATMLLPAGAGVLAKAKDKLKQTLQAEGLFAPQRKKPIPAYAENIGVITSGEGAAWADIQKVAYSRWPGVRLQLYAAAVQGTNAPSQLAAALAKADQGGHDVLICGRGGGSTEDLAAFDSEQVVRAIAAVATPLISAVGHEVDVTLADLVADMRAATPSQGAELAVFSAGVLRENLAETEQRFKKYFSRYLTAQQENLGRLAAAPLFRDARQMLVPAMTVLSNDEQNLRRLAQEDLARRGVDLAALSGRLELLSPRATLARGYALAFSREGQLISAAEQVAVGAHIKVQLAAGALNCIVEQKEEG